MIENNKEAAILLKNLPNSETSLVLKAFEFSQKTHSEQKRFSGEPYFIHPYETAKIIADMGMSSTMIAAGLLHDSLEDGGISGEELESKFGKEILFLIQGVTKLGKLKYRGLKRHNESLRKLFVAISQDVRVIIIKLADRLHNVRTLEFVPEHKRNRIAAETLEIYVPIAYRLGIRKLSRELEDAAFPFVYPKEYEKTKKLLKEKSGKEDMGKLDRFQKSIRKALAKKGVSRFRVEYRIKNTFSLYKKLLRKEWNIEKVYDISAIRIILSSVEDCYRVLGIIHGIWRPLPGRIKDYIAFPKPNGYKAIHTTIFTGYGNLVEIQVKTEEMHKEAEYGIASHILYKENVKKNKIGPNFFWIRGILPFKKNFNGSREIDFNDVPGWIRDLVEYQKSSTDQENLEKELKDDFFQRRIFVFTPKGDVVDLPADSCPIDFAYAIHSDIGNHISGAKVNKKLTSLDDKLKNGDIVEIITKKECHPNRKWLDHIKTTAAKKHIKAALQKR